MAKRKRKPQTYFELAAVSEAQYPEEYKTAKICADKAIDYMEIYSTALNMQSDLTFVLYWLQVTIYANLIMEGLVDQIEAARKSKPLNKPLDNPLLRR